MIAYLCQFHGLLGNAFHKVTITAKARFGDRNYLSEMVTSAMWRFISAIMQQSEGAIRYR